MAILATQSFDGLSESETINTAALGAPWSVFAANTNPVAQASAANHGARGAYIAPASGAVRVQWEEAQSSATRVLSWYFRLLVDGGANTYFSSLSDGVTGRGDWRINADRTVTLRNAGVATGGASPEVLAMNTWYRAEWMTSTSGQELRIYEGESETPYITRTGALTSNLHTLISCGIVATPNGHSIEVDTMRIADDWTGPFVPPDPDPDPEPNPSLISELTFNDLSEAQTINTAALPGTWEAWYTTTIPTARAAAAVHGARGMLIPAADSYSFVRYVEAQTTDTRVLSWYFRLLVDGAANSYFAGVYDDGTSRADWRINADRTVTLRNAGVATGGASPQALQLNTVYRAEYRVGSDGQELRIYEGEGTTPYLTRTGAVTNAQHTRIICGILASPAGHSLHIDTVRVGTDWLGPYDTTPPPRTPTAYRYTGGGNWIALDKPVSIV